MLNIITKALFILWPIVFYTAYKTDTTIWAIIFILALFTFKLIQDFKGKSKALNLMSLVLLLIVGFSALLFDKHDLLMLYPVCVSAYLALIFSLSLFKKRSAIELMARLKDKYLNAYAIKYTRSLTKVWIAFFIVNGSIALFTVLYKNIELWFLYNGFISYIILASLLVLEIPIRLKLIKRQENMLVKHDFLKLFSNSRHNEDIVFFDNKRKYTVLHVQYLIKAYVDLLKDKSQDKVILMAKDNLNFCASFFACLICNKKCVLCSLFTLSNKDDFIILEDVDEDLINAIDTKCQKLIKDGQNAYNFDADLKKTLLQLDNVSYESSISLYTSGSTGSPKEVVKSLKAMVDESELFLKSIDKRHVVALYSSVMPQHLYGLSFAFFMPLITGIKIYRHKLTTPESLNCIKKDSAFITSPTLLSNLDFNLKAPVLSLIMSAGGKLQTSVVKSFFAWTGCAIQEIYGSTETGIIATRENAGDDTLWQVFDGLNFIVENDNILLKSPLFDGTIKLDDKLDFKDAQHFQVLGRKDRVVKIGEKRFSLNMLENIIKELNFVNDVYVLTITHKSTTRPACVIALSDMSLVSKSQDKIKLIQEIKYYMQERIDRLAIPRWYRFVDKIPVNEMGKKQKHIIEGLFRK